VVVTVATVAVALVAARRAGRAAILAIVLAVIAIPAVVIIGPPGGKVRWSDSLSAGANVDERATSNRAALELIVENPFGLGVVRGQNKLIERSSISATHNAFLQAGLYIGLPMALILIVACCYQLWGLLHGVEHPTFWKALMAVHLIGLFLFEEHLNNPTFVILVSWMLALSAARAFGPARD
jgi:O-antigen ligase